MKLAQFAGSKPTTKFIWVVDKLFDICNSSSYIAKSFKAPLDNHNLSFRLTDLHNIANYLSQLTEDYPVRTPLTQGWRKTAVIEFVITIKSICGLTQRLLKRHNHPFMYLLTYKLSQDHLETLFSRIRRRGGRNNNPNTLQFKYALRSCLLKNGIRASKKANCQEPSDVLLSVEPPELTIINQEDHNTFITDNEEVIQFVKLIQQPSLFHDSVLFYM
ncbi:THAP domain-containing protein 9 [Elysia marginata]|uniref:THAP domain-containing protein 9 n=1 Tax=Elysia marginata TaxID=1093978 RepID=A0AAV4EQ07_9GAST|nr:THAP domain-containing protein 9 [Elysia marginata]